MGAQFIKHIIWDDLATSGWKHLFPMQSNLKKFEEIWRFILLIRSLSRRCARRQNLNVVVWDNIIYFWFIWAKRALALELQTTHISSSFNGHHITKLIFSSSLAWCYTAESRFSCCHEVPCLPVWGSVSLPDGGAAKKVEVCSHWFMPAF